MRRGSHAMPCPHHNHLYYNILLLSLLSSVSVHTPPTYPSPCALALPGGSGTLYQSFSLSFSFPPFMALEVYVVVAAAVVSMHFFLIQPLLC